MCIDLSPGVRTSDIRGGGEYKSLKLNLSKCYEGLDRRKISNDRNELWGGGEIYDDELSVPSSNETKIAWIDDSSYGSRPSTSQSDQSRMSQRSDDGLLSKRQSFRCSNEEIVAEDLDVDSLMS